MYVNCFTPQNLYKKCISFYRRVPKIAEMLLQDITMYQWTM